MSSHAWNSKWTKTQLRDALDRQFDEWYSLLAQRDGELEALRAECGELKRDTMFGAVALQESVGEIFTVRAERDALAEKVATAVSRSAWAVCPFCGFLNRPYDQKPSADDHKESCPWLPVFAALSDNPDGPELPEDSTCKWPHGYLDPRLGRCPNCSHPINDVPDRPDNTDSPALTDKEDEG